MTARIPEAVRVLLWDVDVAQLSLAEHYKFVIERIVEYGDLPEVRWMQRRFSTAQIVETLTQSRRISAKSGNFFRLLYDLPPEAIPCLTRPFTRRQDRF